MQQYAEMQKRCEISGTAALLPYFPNAAQDLNEGNSWLHYILLDTDRVSIEGEKGSALIGRKCMDLEHAGPFAARVAN